MQKVEKEVLNKQEACELLNISRKTLENFMRDGVIVPILRYKKTTRFLKSDLLKSKF